MKRINGKDNYIPSRTSPKSDKRGCLCKDSNTYSRNCCKGDIVNQGIGNIGGKI